MTKRGRPPLPSHKRTNGVRVILRPQKDLVTDIRDYAAYFDKSVQEMTREWWEFLIKRADAKNLDFRGASKNN